MKIAFFNLKPALAATAPAWRTGIDRLLARASFVLGDEVRLFEQEFAARMNARYAVGTGSGTDAIDLCLREAGLAHTGAEVLTSPLTAPFTGLAILNAGCVPRFADVDPDTLLLDAVDAGNRATRKTSAIVPVHLYGQPCEMNQFQSLAADRRAVLVQDACQAHGATYRSRPLAAFSRYVAYSFYPTKNLGCLGDGGAVVTNGAAVARRLRLLRDGGRRAGHVSVLAGTNSRLDEIQACYLRAGLPRLEEWNRERARLAATYDAELGSCPAVRRIRRPAGSVYHLYVIRIKNRARLQGYLAGHGIGTAVHYPVPLHLQPAFSGAGYRRGDLPQAEKASREVLSLPLWPGMTDGMVREVAERIRRFYSRGILAANRQK